MLLLKEIFDPVYGMFQQSEDSNMIWFSNNPFEDEIMYYLIGECKILATRPEFLLKMCKILGSCTIIYMYYKYKPPASSRTHNVPLLGSGLPLKSLYLLLKTVLKSILSIVGLT